MSNGTKVPLNDLRRGVVALADDYRAAFERVLDSGWYVMGPEHDAFERELAAFVGTQHAIAVSDGTAALGLALSAVGVAAGSTVLTAANAGGYTSAAAEALGARPVYADVEASTHLLSARTLDQACEVLRGRPDAVVVTHLYGAAAPMPEICAWASSIGLPVVEDCAQSLGAKIGTRPVGSFGDIATTSFYPTKNLGALGDGGAVLTSRADLAEVVRRRRQYGWSKKYTVSDGGGRNSRLDELQAAFLRMKLLRLEEWNERRRAIHLEYERAFREVGDESTRMVNSAIAGSFVAHLAVVETTRREELRVALADAGIGSEVHYPTPDHLQPLRVPNDVSLPVTERLAQSVLSMPLFPELTDGEVGRVAAALAEFAHAG